MGFYLNKFKHLTNKQEMNTAATALFVFTMICAWSAFGLGVSSVGAKTWIYKTSTFEGLWQSCVSADNCTKIAEDATLNACRAFVIMGIAITFIGTVLYQSSFWQRRNTGPVLKVSYGLIYLGALCWSVAMIVYSYSCSSSAYEFYTASYCSSFVAWGYPYAFGWACVGLTNLAGAFAWASAKKREDSF